MDKEFVIWTWSPNTPKWSIALGQLVNFDKAYLFSRGTPLADTFPKDVALKMDPDHPRNTIPTDNLQNNHRLLVISERLKNFLEARPLGLVEYLPVTILDLNQKPLEQRYFILNTLNYVDCLDIAQSEPTMNQIRKHKIDTVKRLVLDPSRVDGTRELFRIANYDSVTLASAGLAKDMDAAGFTSIGWTKLEDLKRWFA